MFILSYSFVQSVPSADNASDLFAYVPKHDGGERVKTVRRYSVADVTNRRDRKFDITQPYYARYVLTKSLCLRKDVRFNDATKRNTILQNQKARFVLNTDSSNQ